MDGVLITSLRAPESWERIRREFRTRNFMTLRQLATVIPGVDVDGLDRLLGPHDGPCPTAEAIEVPLGRAFSATAGRSAASPVLAALIYGICLKRWENSTDHAPVEALASAARDVCIKLHNTEEGNEACSDRLAAVAILDLAISLRSCMRAENALNCSCPIDMRRHAHDAMVAAEHVLLDLPANPAEDDPVRGFIRQAAQAQASYFGALCRVAEAVEDFLSDPQTCREGLTAAIKFAEAAELEPTLRDDVYESELRAHRMTLAAMREKATSPVLHVDEGKIAYCYPFAVVGADPTAVVKAVAALRCGAVLGGARVVETGKLDVTDLWEANDPEGRCYIGAMATLEDLLIVTTAGEQLPAHHVELRVSTLGICYLRIWTWLADISAHGLNQAMRRGLVQMGAETIRQDGAIRDEWSRLATYAEQVLSGLEDHLAALFVPGLRVVFSVERRHHTVVSLRGFSQVSPAGQRKRLYSHADIRETVGAALIEQHANHAAATLEEYVRYPSRTPHAFANDIGFQGESLVRNADFTVAVMPTSPNFIVIGYEEMAEFSAALPALIDQWIELIWEQRRKLYTDLHDIDKDSAPVTIGVGELEDCQAQLRSVIGEVRSMLAFIKSPTLCRTNKYREVLDMLFDAAGVGRLEADLEAEVAKVDVLFDQVRARTVQREERRTQRSRTCVEVAVAVLAVTSLADFFMLINSALVNRSLFVEVGVILVISVVVTLEGMRSHKRSSSARDRSRRQLLRGELNKDGGLRTPKATR